MTRSDLRFPLATGPPVGPSPFYFSWPLRLLLRVFHLFPGCFLGFLLFRFCTYFSFFVFCLGWFSLFYLGEFSFRSSFLGSLLPFSTLSSAILPSSSVDGRGYLAAVLASVAGLCLPSFGLLPCVLAQFRRVQGFGVHPGGSLLSATLWFPGLLMAVPMFLPQQRVFLRLPLSSFLSSSRSPCFASFRSYLERFARGFGFSSLCLACLPAAVAPPPGCPAKPFGVSVMLGVGAIAILFRFCPCRVASFLLSLSCSLALSCSSLALFGSVFFGIFRLALPGLSLLILFFVLSASSVLFLRLVFLLGFSLRPLLLRAPPFDPLSPCFLRSHAWESLLLVSLAMACWVRVLRAVSEEVFLF